MPLVRGRILPEVELSGRAKLFLDVLLWTEELRAEDLRSLEELEILRTYLRSVHPVACDIRLWVPSHHEKTMIVLSARRIEFDAMDAEKADQKLREKLSSSPPNSQTQFVLRWPLMPTAWS